MTVMLLAEFRDAEALGAAVHGLPPGARAHDAYTPFPVPGLAEALGQPTSRIRIPMFAAFVLIAGGAYFMEWLSAVYLYPINAGGRPLHSWPVFVLFPFEIGVLAAAVAGLLALLWRSGLPRLNHPLFDVHRFAAASQDRFFLAAEAPAPAFDARRLHAALVRHGAVMVTEVGL
ncbi:MAG TPA: DUF3341 domain-containing protein [Hyphomicrobiales bacterium]|nr:DUF3341 domain-containing protein [Hyphomicrobiales bacterium]